MLSPGRALFVRTVLTVLVLLCGALAAPAQQCDPPVPPPQISAPVQVCPYAPAQASVLPPAEGSWSNVSWSISNGGFVDANGNPVTFPNGETVHFYGNGSGPVTLYAYAQDSFGCSTSTQGSAEVQIRTIPAPQISAPVQVCPYAPAQASIVPPAEGSWSNVSWSISNGGFVDASGNPVNFPNGETVHFYGNGSGPVTLYAYAQDSFGCSTSTQGSAEVQIRTIPAPQISAPVQVCPYAPAQASILPPAEGSWSNVSWSISNGGFVDANGNPVNFPNGETVHFYGNGSGPVTLYAYAQDSFGCSTSAQGSAVVQIRTIPAPQISAPEEVCPYSPAQASILPPAEGSWSNVSWSISNGGFVDANGNPVMYPNGETVHFYGNGSGPVTLYAYAQDSFGCSTSTQGSAEVQIRTIAAPQISAPPQVCTYTPATASLLPPPEGTWSVVSWSITNGGFLDAGGNPVPYPNGETVRFYASSSAEPVTLFAYAQDSFGCSEQGTITIPTVPGDGGQPPSITLSSPDVCGAEPITAGVAGSFSSYEWEVVNGTITSGQNTSEITFAANGAGPVTVSVVTNTASCPSSDAKTLQLRGEPAQLWAPASACAGSLQRAFAANWYSNFSWTAANATIEGPSDQMEVSFRPAGTGPVTLSLQALDYEGCFISNSVTIPLDGLPVPVIGTPQGDTVCPGRSLGVQTDRFYTAYSWHVTNATILDGQGTDFITFQHTSGAGDVVVTLNVGDGACSADTQKVIAVRPAVDVVAEIAAPTVCANGTGTVYIDNYDTFSHVSVYVNNGTITGISAGRVPGGRTYTFRNNGFGNTTIDVHADSASCLKTASFTATMVSAATATITASGPTTFCEGGSVTLTAPASASYLWSNGATTQSIVVSASGSYSVTVTNANGCSATSAATNVTVNPLPAVPVISASGSTNLCPGQSVTLTAPAGFSYQWSNGATTQSITVSTPGSYSVTVTNANGCQRTSAPVNVAANPPTVITTHPVTQTMPRNVTRVLSVVATGTATLQYQWYEGASGNMSLPVAGATGSTLTIGPFNKKGTRQYWVRVTSTGCPDSSANSNTATITIN